MNILQEFKKIKKQQLFENFLQNKRKQQKKAYKLIALQNKSNIIYNFNVSKVYQLENLHNKINWYKYYIELYLKELIAKYETIENNKINLQ